jgi:hypothetical protein
MYVDADPPQSIAGRGGVIVVPKGGIIAPGTVV